MFRWTVHPKRTPPSEPSECAAVPVGHRVYCFVPDYPYSDRSLIGVHEFNTVSLRWTALSQATAGRELPPVVRRNTAVLVEEIIYILGGSPRWDVLYAFHTDTHGRFTLGISGLSGRVQRRYDHSACVLGKVMYIYGGRTHMTGGTSDIYKLDTATMVWSLIDIRGPPPPFSSGHSATIIGTKMFVFGGRGSRGLDNIRVFDTETDCWLSTPPAQLHPEQRYSHSAFASNGELYIFGGSNINWTFNDLWKFNPETSCWKKVEPKGKGPRSGPYNMCCCMVGDRIILFGGWDKPDDPYILDCSPSLKTLCKLSVLQYRLEQSGLRGDIRWELAAMTTEGLCHVGAITGRHYGTNFTGRIS